MFGLLRKNGRHRPPSREEVVDVKTNDGAILSVLDAGPRNDSGSAIVFLHGWAMSRAYWAPLMERLGDKRRVVAIDFRSHGSSPPCFYGHRTDRYARDVNNVLTARGIDAPILVGWSMGASVLFSYVDHYTDEGLAGVVVVDQTPKLINDDTWSYGAIGLDGACVEQTLAAIRTDYAGFLHSFIPTMFAGDVCEEDHERFVAIGQRLRPQDAAALLFDHAVRDWRDVVERLKKPILAISGAQYAAANGANGIKSLAPHARTEIFQNSAHCCFMEEVDKFEKRLSEF